MRVWTGRSDSGRMWRLAGIGAFLAAGMLVLGACGDDTRPADSEAPAETADTALMGGAPDRQLTVAFQDITFTPMELTITAGEIIELDVENAGALTHDLTIERIDAELAMQHQPARHVPAGHDAHGDAAAVHLALAPGDRMVARLRVAEPGTYDFYCAEPGHREAGMVGTLIVM